MNKYFIYILIFFTPLFSQEVIGEGLNGEDLINYLQNNYTTNSVLSYNNARDILYSEIDKQSNGNVYCIYTNYSTYLPTNVDPSIHLYDLLRKHLNLQIPKDSPSRFTKELSRI